MTYSNERDTPQYKEWRQKVIARDNNKCQMPGCTSKSRKIDVHHIQRWADAPLLRYVVSNGICLHKSCHYQIRNNEHYFIQLFMEIVRDNS